MSEGHNKPPVTITLDADMAEFLLENCAANIEMGLKTLSMLSSRDLMQRMVDNIEQFKKLRQAVVDAKLD